MNIDDINQYNSDFKNINIQKNILKYYKTIKDFLEYFDKNIKVDGKKEYIIKRGIGVINNVFMFTLMYTKNIDMALFYSKKAHFYYCEFIQQINQDIHTYLQLTSKDASIFVYKKTIFNINSEFKKEYIMDDKSKEIINKFRNLTGLINKIIFKCSEKKIKNIINRIADHKNIDFIMLLIQAIKDEKISKEKYCNIIYKFIKKITKSNLSRDDLFKKIHSNHFSKNIQMMDSLKFVKWIFAR